MMFRRIMLAALVGVLVSGAAAPALADHCPMDAKRIYEALERASDNSAAKARTLTILGTVLHKNGDHDKALKVLHGAMEMLGISH